MSLSELTLSVFLLFCRIGGCLTVMPGFSSPRVPVRVRLLAAIGITMALAPVLVDRIAQAVRGAGDAQVLLFILRESVVGGSIGLLGRVLFAGLETLCAAAATAVGYGNAFGVRVDEGEALPELASFVMLGATTLFFVTDGHAAVVRALASSYDALGFGEPFDPRKGLVEMTGALARAFPLALQITGPFVLYGLVVNFAFGLLNRLVPQIPVYFVSTPFVVAGGLLLLYATCGTLLALFTDAFGGWLARG